MRRSWPACSVIVLAACSSGAPAPAARRSADKSSLFADPTLVPTREGEAARRELAASGEITAALRATSWLDDVRVDVEHHGSTRVVVAGRRSTNAPDDLEAHVHAVVTSVCGEYAVLTLAIADAPVHAERPTDLSRNLPLGLALFGLGASLALSADRLWRRRRRALMRRGGHRAPR